MSEWPVEGAYERELARRRAVHERVTPWRVVKELAVFWAEQSVGGRLYGRLSATARRCSRWIFGLGGAALVLVSAGGGELAGGVVTAVWAFAAITVMRSIDRDVDDRAREPARRQARREEIRRRIAGKH